MKVKVLKATNKSNGSLVVNIVDGKSGRANFYFSEAVMGNRLLVEFDDYSALKTSEIKKITVETKNSIYVLEPLKERDEK